MTVSGSIGRRMPTRSPSSTPSPAAARPPATPRRRARGWSARGRSPSSPSQVIAMPSGSRSARGSTAAHDQSNAPPIHQRAHAGPPLSRATSRRPPLPGDRRCRPRPRPRTTPGPSTARAWSASSVGSPVERRNRASRASAAVAGSGRHATSGASRPKIGQSSVGVSLTTGSLRWGPSVQRRQRRVQVVATSATTSSRNGRVRPVPEDAARSNDLPRTVPLPPRRPRNRRMASFPHGMDRRSFYSPTE